jgi:hypothetical protein
LAAMLAVRARKSDGSFIFLITGYALFQKVSCESRLGERWLGKTLNKCKGHACLVGGREAELGDNRLVGVADGKPLGRVRLRLRAYPASEGGSLGHNLILDFARSASVLTSVCLWM